MMYLFYNCCRP